METNPTAASSDAPPAQIAVRRLSAPEAESLLSSGLAIAAEMMGSAFPALCRPVADGLITRIDADPGAPAVRRLVGGKTMELRDAFVGRLQERQAEVLARISSRPRAATFKHVTAESMTLVEADAITSSAVIDKTSGRVRGIVEDSLRDLHVVVSYLAGRDQLRPYDDPFGPDVFMRAIMSAGDDLGLHSSNWDAMAAAFERPLGDELRRIYVAVIEHYRANGLDPRAIRRELAAKQAAQFKGQSTPDGASGPPPAPDSDPLGGIVPRPASIGAGGGAQLPADAAAVLGNLMTRLQANARGEPLPRGLASLGVAPPALLDAVRELQRLGLEGLHGATIAAGGGEDAAWREHLLSKSNRTVDKLTIEIVGMLFEHVLQDKQVPAEIKAMISRLQFPVLKVALLDADFFASGNHPARRLIDRIASTAIGWEPYGDENEKYRLEVERVVRTVLEQFDKDNSIFEKLLGEFDLFVGETSTRDNDPVSRAKRALEEAEKREILVINTTIQVRRAFERVELEPYLRDFLVGPWVQALVTAIMRDDTTPGFSKNFRQVIHDLVWSVQPKVSADDRKRLVAMIPPMMRVLRDGLGAIRMPEHEQNAFFQQLMQSHAMSVRPVDQATYIKSSLVSSELRSRIDEMRITGTFPITTVAGGVRVSEGAVMRAAEQHAAQVMIPVPPTDLAPLDRAEELDLEEQISKWQRGTWFDLWNGTEFVRARLRWISPLRTLFMFSCNKEAQARVLAPDVLKSYVKRGWLKPLESEPLMKRAVDGVVDKFEKMPKRGEEVISRFAAA